MNRSTRRAARRTNAYTMIEVAVATSIIGVIIVVVGQFFIRGTSAASGFASQAYAESRLATQLDRVISEMVSARFASMTPPLAENSPVIRFQRIVTSGVPPTYGNPIQIELVPVESNIEDAIDNDGNGLIDECAIRIWEDHAPFGSAPGVEDSPVTLSENATADGLSFTREGAVVLVEMRSQAVVERDQPPMILTLRSGIRMRNTN